MENLVISAYISAAFFSTNHYSGIITEHAEFSSSSSKNPHKLEVPIGMVALACVGVGPSTVDLYFVLIYLQIHACLNEHGSGNKHPFPTAELPGVWALSVKILNDLKRRSRSKYHQVMHKIYSEAR